MADKNILMQEFNRSGYDNLYPQIIPSFNQDVNLNSNRIINLASPQNNADAVNKQYVDDSQLFKKIKMVNNLHVSLQTNQFLEFSFTFPSGFTENDIFNVIGIKLDLRNVNSAAGGNLLFSGSGPTVAYLKAGTYPSISAIYFNIYADTYSSSEYIRLGYPGGYNITVFGHKIGTNTGIIAFKAELTPFTFDTDVYFIM